MKKATIAALVFYEAAAIADWWTTSRAISTGRYLEENPGAAFVINTVGLDGFLIVKQVIGPLGCFGAALLIRRMQPAWRCVGHPAFYLLIVGGAQTLGAWLNWTTLAGGAR